MDTDPRDKRFFQLRKRDVSQLSPAEIAELISYCDKMIPLVRHKAGRRTWKVWREKLQARLSAD